MKASAPIADAPIWPEALAMQAARSQLPPPGETAGRSAVAERPVKARTAKRDRPDREPGLKRANFGQGAGLPTLLLLPQLLRLLPGRLLAALDAWSYRLAQQKADTQRRRRCVTP